jgi:hypothetical protein
LLKLKSPEMFHRHQLCFHLPLLRTKILT